MLRTKLALVCGCVLAIGSGTRAASLLDDTPTLLAGWQSPIGYVSVADNAFMPASLGITNRLLLTTGVDEATNVPSAGAVEGYVGAIVDVGGHPGFDAGPAVEGSAVRRTFSARPGDLVTISFDFLTAEGSAAFSELSPAELAQLPAAFTDDFAFVAITHAGVTQVTRLADVLTPGLADIFDASGERFLYHTGFRTLQLTLPSGPNITDGAYAIAFGVMDGTGNPTDRNHIGESALLIESVSVSGPSAVPLPASASAGIVLLGSYLAVSLARRVRSA